MEVALAASRLATAAGIAEGAILDPGNAPKEFLFRVSPPGRCSKLRWIDSAHKRCYHELVPSSGSRM